MTKIVVTSNSAEVSARLGKRVKASVKDIQQLVVNATNLVEETVVKGSATCWGNFARAK